MIFLLFGLAWLMMSVGVVAFMYGAGVFTLKTVGRHAQSSPPPGKYY